MAGDRRARSGASEEEPAPGAPPADDLVISGEERDGGDLPSRVSRHFELHAQLLHAMHASHERLVKALERGDRADVVVRSTDALNRTFRQLHESQATLAQELLRERRRGPWRTAAAVLLAGGLLAAAGFFVVRETVRPIGAEVERLAAARAEAERSGAALAIELRDDGRRILEAVDQGLAANRVLSNENRAREVEVERLRAELAALDERALAAERARDAALDESAAAEAKQAAIEEKLNETRAALDEARTELVDRDLSRSDLEQLLESTVGGAAAKADAPPPEVVAAGRAAEELRDAVNAFLADAGLIGLRLLRADGVVDGHLDRALFELRNDQGYPIGFHDAARARFRVDPDTQRGEIVLKGGSTVVRGVRSPFPGGELVLVIPAVAPGTYSAGPMAALTDVLPDTPSASPSPHETVEAPVADPVPAPAPPLEAAPPAAAVEDVAEASADPPAEDPPPSASPAPFDPAPLLAALNEGLRADGGGRLEFDQVKGLDAAGLEDVIAHHYGPSGQLSKTVVARRCRIELDDRDREVVFRFVDGHHVTRGREVPFFRGRGDDAGTWTHRVRGVEVEKWEERLEAGGWRPGDG